MASQPFHYHLSIVEVQTANSIRRRKRNPGPLTDDDEVIRENFLVSIGARLPHSWVETVRRSRLVAGDYYLNVYHVRLVSEGDQIGDDGAGSQVPSPYFPCIERI